MESLCYFAFDDVTGNYYKKCCRSSTKRPIMANCAGLQTYNEKSTHSFVPTGRSDYYYMYVIKGGIKFSLPEKRTATAGSAAIIRPNTGYRYKNLSQDTRYYWVHFTGSDAQRLLNEYGFDKDFDVINSLNSQQISAAFCNIFDFFATRVMFYENRISSEVEKIMLITAEAALSYDENSDPIAKTVKYIRSYYTQNISVADLAKQENMSVTKYNYTFLNRMGTSPVKYMTKLRMENACRMLLESDIPINRIGELCGYVDSHYFSRVFKKYTGISAAAYRKRGKDLPLPNKNQQTKNPD